MTDSAPKKPKLGRFRKCLLLIVLMPIVGVAVAVCFMVQPQDMSDIGGYTSGVSEGSPRDLKEVLQNAVNRRYEVTLTETEINLWLQSALKMEQKGLLADRVSDSRVWVRLGGDGVAEVILERKVFGHPLTFSMFIQIVSEPGKRKEGFLHGGPYLECFSSIKRGGRFGRLVVPQGYLYLILPSFRQLAEVFSEELRLAIDEMEGIKIEKNRLILNPTLPHEDVELGFPQLNFSPK